MASFTIDVRDLKNPERLLGRLIGRPVSTLHGRLEVAVMPRLSNPYVYSRGAYAAPDETTHSRVRFDVSYRTEDGGYTKRAELLTDAPLGVLQMIHSFRLPGETERQADNRRALSVY